MIVIMSGELEDLLGRPVDPTVIYDHPTINALAAHFAALGMER
jgi:polyketide synthase 13